MKQPKNAKISHYDTGNPWDKSKPQNHAKKLAKMQKQLEAETPLVTVGWESDGWVTDWKEPEYIELFVARKVPEDALVIGEKMTIEGCTFSIHKKSVIKEPQKYKHNWITFVDMSAILPTYNYIAGLWPPERERKRRVDRAVESFVEEPLPLLESPLILSPELQEHRRREAQKGALKTLVMSQIEAVEKPLVKRIEEYGQQASILLSRQMTLKAEKIKLKEEIGALRVEIEQLKHYRAKVKQEITIQERERTRYFRAEE